MSVKHQTKELTLKLIKQGEGCRLQVYTDSLGHKTVFWGHLVKPGETFPDLSQQAADKVLEKDYKIAEARAIKKVGGIENFNKLSTQRQAVLIDLTFNMGEKSFPKFQKAIKDGNYNQAAYQLLQSQYRMQTKSRSLRNALMILKNQAITKSQAQQICIQNGVICKDKNGKAIYNTQVKDPKIKKIYDISTQNITNDAVLAKQADKLKQFVGGVSFNIDPISTRLNGFISQDFSAKMIQSSIYDPTNFSMMDLVIPLKIMYDPQIQSKNISVSLDPYILTQPDGPWYRKVFYPNQLANTIYGQDMIAADFLMKQLSLGVNQNNQPYNYSKRLLQMGININSIFNSLKELSYEGSRTRLWIVIKDYQIVVNQRFFQIKNIVMGVQLKCLELSQNGSLRDCNGDPSPIAKRFAQIFTKYYDQLCQYYPILSKMKRLAKASIISKLMFLRRIPVDLKLINHLYQKQKTQYVQKLPRLHNKLIKQSTNKTIQMSVLGGCTFDISNIQQKVNELDKQIQLARQIFQSKHQISNSLPLKVFDKQNIGKYLFINNEKQELVNKNIYPFLFQKIVQCRICNKVCKNDYYSITNRECYDHSTMKCKICHKIVIPGQNYKTNSDKTMTFHDKCFKCNSCNKKIEGSYANIDGGNYHAQCIPKKSIGKCKQCNKQIYQGESYAQNPQTKDLYHDQCALLVNKRIQDSIPQCKQCKVKLNGLYVKYQGESYHELCVKKMLGQS